MKLDFYASQTNMIDHLAPVWDALPAEARGTFYVTESVRTHAWMKLKHQLYLFVINKKALPQSPYPILTASYGDMLNAWKQDPGRKLVRMEHGVGITFGTAGYADGKGRRDKVELYLFPNAYLAAKHRALYGIPYQVIGTPKLDWVTSHHFTGDAQTVCIAFHWGNKNTVPPESGSAFEHYRDVIPSLATRFHLIGHGHPMERERHRSFFESIGVEYVDDFDEVMQRAAVYVGDISSTIYEFLTTGKPVIMLNAPWFRRDVHYGLRFWDYTDIGPVVENPDRLGVVIKMTLDSPGIRRSQREKAVRDLYPFLGVSAMLAAEVLVNYLEEIC